MDGPRCAAEIVGELSIYHAHYLKQRLLELVHAHCEVDVDLSQVTEVDTAGLQLLILAKRDAAALDRSLRYFGHSKAVLEFLDLYDLTASFGDPVVISAHP
ncbi:MAG: STAS domain-containing protein [Burkholderiales bacterium]|nr:MAG: STAS domain-containing protein [Burkholderiales bacterium]